MELNSTPESLTGPSGPVSRRFSEQAPPRAWSPVALLRWPEEQAEIEALRSRRVPRVLLVREDVAAPVAVGIEEDWIRSPASSADIEARVAGVLARTSGLDVALPTAIGDGRLEYRGDWVPLSPIEETIVQALIERYGEVVPLAALSRHQDGDLSANAVRVHIMRLRRRIEPLGLAIRSVHGRGYVVDVDPAPGG